MKKLFFGTFFFLIAAATVQAQDIAIGQWREHLAYTNAVSVTQGQGKIYCATTSGIFSYNQSDNSYDRLSKVTGLSDIGATCIKFNNYNNSLLIVYSDGNLDLVKNNTVINDADIKNKAITSSKNINSIYFINQYAYLACGFGIVVFDTQQQTIADTYYIGTNGTYLNVRDITSDGTNLYAATDNGIYEAPLNSPNLADYNNWTKETTKVGGGTLPTGIYNTIASINGKVFANFSNHLTHNAWKKDSVFESTNGGNTWAVFTGVDSTNVQKIEVSNNHLVFCTLYSVDNFDNNNNLLGYVYYNNLLGANGMNDVDALVDQNNSVWVADENVGLVKFISASSGKLFAPNGPKTANVFAMAMGNNTLWAVPGGVDGSWNNLYNRDGIFIFNNDSWSTTNPCNCGLNSDTLYDEMAVAVDPNDPTHAYVGSWGKGLLEFHNGSVVNLFTDQNTNGAIQGLNLPGYDQIRIAGLAFDQNGYIWASNSGVAHNLCYRPPDGTWKGLNFSAFISSAATVGNVMVTQSGEKWVILARGTGILVYQDNGTFAQPNSSNTKILNGTTGNGGLISTNIFSMAQDQTGAVWVGTDQGIEVFYSPDAIFSGSGGWDAQQILLEQNGLVQILLQTQTVTAIAVDGANRKWLGTYGGGVFLMSADGTQQIQHFTAENSPLLSDNISSIAINPNTGEVFFGTDKGIVSYKSTATEGGTDFENVYAYPNPVPHDYSGPIAIKGLVQNADVRITDITGKLVYKTTALGGQAIWQGTNFDGRRVQSGVYLVFCSNSDGSKTFVTKILFIN